MSRSTRWPAIAAITTLCALGALVAWLATRRGARPPPRHGGPEPSWEAAPSVLAVPVRLELAQLAATLEEQVPEQLLRLEGDPVREGWLLDLDLRRTGPVRARGEDQVLQIDLPLSARARLVRARRADRRFQRGRGPPQGVAIAFEAVLELRTALSLAEDWGLDSHTALALRWIDPPTATVGPLRLGIGRPVERALGPRLDEVGARIDARIAEQDRTRAAVQELWERLARPIPLSTDPPLWLVARPEALFASDLTVEEEALTLMVGYRGGLQTVLGEAPPVRPAPLPTRSPPPPGEAGFTLVLPVVLEWEALSALGARAAREHPLGRIGSEGSIGLEILDVVLYPSGERVAVRLDYRADHPGWTTDGTLYLLARPELDRPAREVRLVDFEYAVDTWDRTVLGANALARDRLRQWVGERLRFSYGEALNGALERADRALRAGAPTERGGTARGSVEALELRRLHLSERGLWIELRATGRTALEVVPRPVEGGFPPIRP